ncbi:MAG: pentapeptide repeat-containing protein [Chloroflexota bacterium]
MRRNILAFAAIVTLLVLPVAGIAAPGAVGPPGRGIAIGAFGVERKDHFVAGVRWNKRALRGGASNALVLSLVATSGKTGTPVFMRAVAASAKRPGRDYALPLSRAEQDRLRGAGGLGLVATQKADCDGGLYHRAWVTRSGSFPVTPSMRSRCGPLQPGGSYAGCYYGYSDLSDLDVHGANFTDAQFPFTSLPGANLSGANLSYAMLGYANVNNANLSNANLSGAYLMGANMRGANLTGATLTNAQFCNTIMPDGSVNNTNC